MKCKKLAILHEINKNVNMWLPNATHIKLRPMTLMLTFQWEGINTNGITSNPAFGCLLQPRRIVLHQSGII